MKIRTWLSPARRQPARPSLNRIRRFARSLWNRPAHWSFPGRASAKSVLFTAVTVIVLFPHAQLFCLQLGRYFDSDTLLQTNWPALVDINRQIDQALPRPHTRQQEFRTIERFVYQHIRYAYDWDNWGNLDYWPAAPEVWARRKEDCDGRAVLAAAILRSRGYPEATLVGNITHVWVAVGPDQLMGPEKEKNFGLHGGRFSFPSLEEMLDGLAFLSRFPIWRSAILLATALLLAFHPSRNWVGLASATGLAATGFAALCHWGDLRLRNQITGTNWPFWAGLLLLGLALALCLTIHWLDRLRLRPSPKPALAPLSLN